MKSLGAERQPLTHDLLLQLIPDIEDSQAKAIIACGASVGEVEEAIGWATGQSGVMGDLRRQLSANVAAVYSILTSDQDFEGERERE